MFGKTNLRLAAAATALVLAASSAPVMAVTSITGSLAISASVLSTCALTGGAVAFGTYAATQLDQTGTLGVLCTSSVPYTIALDAGAGTGASITARKMTSSGGATLNYNLYRETGRSSNWGNTNTTDTVAGTGTGLLQSVTVYGRIPAGQSVVAGVYTDTVTVTLSY